jgi:hypothetical protein
MKVEQQNLNQNHTHYSYHPHTTDLMMNADDPCHGVPPHDDHTHAKYREA